MAQYDLLITQNVAAAGVEFSEKYVNIPKGSLLSANAAGAPAVLSAGTNGHMIVYDDTEETGLKSQAIAAGHTQNTDSGTTEAIFELDSDGNKIELTAETASKFGVKVDGGATYADLEAKDATFAKVTVAAAPSAGSDLVNKTYADGLIAANDAMVFKGTVGVGGTHEIAAFNALATYNAGWTYRVITAGTIKGVVCEVGDLITCMVDRAGSGELDADWTVMQTNLDGAVTGPISSTDGRFAIFDGVSGKLLKDGAGVPGTMAYETATDYVAKALFDANSVLAANADNTPAKVTVAEQTLIGRITAGNIKALTATEIRTLLNVVDGADVTSANETSHSDVLVDGDFNAQTILAATTNDTPAPLTVGEQTLVGRKTGGNIAALTAAEVMNVVWQTAPATKTSTGTAGMIAKDANWFYICTATDVWKRSPIATNWS